MLTREQLEADIEFLVLRADDAGSCYFGEGRWTGASSNSLVTFAYGGKHSCMPSDRDDYGACLRTVRRLPKHRRTKKVMAALWKARASYLEGHPDDANALLRREQLRAWKENEQTRWGRKRRRASHR